VWQAGVSKGFEARGMTEFRARVAIRGVIDDPIDAILSVSRSVVALSIASQVVGEWRTAELSPARQGDAFLLTAEGELLVVEPDDPDGFAQALHLDAAFAVYSPVSEPMDAAAPLGANRRRGRHLEPSSGSGGRWWQVRSSQPVLRARPVARTERP
jgi:hypothetical protein